MKPCVVFAGVQKRVCWSWYISLPLLILVLDSVYSGSWDKTLRVWDSRSSEAQQLKHNLPEKVFSMDINNNRLVVAMANRQIHVYDIRNMDKPEQERESSLRYMLKCIRCMPDGQGKWSTWFPMMTMIDMLIRICLFIHRGTCCIGIFWCWSSIKEVCLQVTSTSHQWYRSCLSCQCFGFPPNVSDDHVYIEQERLFIYYLYSYGTFASGGSDCVVSIWDGVNRKRIKQFPRYPDEISSLSFSHDGKMLAVASSYTFDEGERDHSPDAIFIKHIGDNECKPRHLSNGGNS